MRLPNQTKPVIRHGGGAKVGIGRAGLWPNSMWGLVMDLAEFQQCAEVLAKCGNDHACYTRLGMTKCLRFVPQ